MLAPRRPAGQGRRRCCGTSEGRQHRQGYRAFIAIWLEPSRAISKMTRARASPPREETGKPWPYSPDFRTYPRASAATTAAVLDAGLRAYMLRVYNWMASGLLLTGIVAYAIANTSADRRLLSAGADRRSACGASADGAGDDRDLRAAGLRAGAELGVNRLSRSAAQALYLGVLRRDGRQPDEHLPDLHRASRSCGCSSSPPRTFARDEPLWLHDQGRSEPHGQLPDDGAVRHHHRQPGEHVLAQHGAAVRGQHHRRAWCSPA